MYSIYGKADLALNFCGTLHDPRIDLLMIKITKICIEKDFDFCKI